MEGTFVNYPQVAFKNLATMIKIAFNIEVKSHSISYEMVNIDYRKKW